MHFCEKCDNMYYIKLDKDNEMNLIYYCRNCGNEKMDLNNANMCVLDIDLKQNKSDDDSNINEFTKYDPTLPRINNIKCPNPDCITNSESLENSKEGMEQKKTEIMYMRYDNINMKYLYICPHCDFTWKTNNIN